MKRIFLFAVLAALLCACTTQPVQPTMPMIQTTAPLTTPVVSAAPPSTAPAAQQETVESVYAVEYLPQLNSCITTQYSVGAGQKTQTALVYGVFAANQTPDYVMTAFVEEQPFYYTDYFLCDEGWFVQFSDSEAEAPTFIMPQQLYPGLCFEGEDGPAEVIGVDQTVQVGAYVFENALLLAVDSTTYGAQVFVVYQRGVGEAIRYIQYDASTFEILSMVTNIEIWEDAQVQALIENTIF